MSARIHASNAVKSSPRKNTPAALISSSMPQYFSRGVCKTMRTGVPRSITELSYELAESFRQIRGRSLQSLYLRHNRRTNHRRVGITLHVFHLVGAGETN